MIHGAVIDFSALVPGAPADLVDPVLAYAGQDLSHWFTKGSDGLPEVSRAVAGGCPHLCAVISFRSTLCVRAV